MLPTREEALKLIRDGLLFNPGPWGEHCLTAAHCAEKIASACGDMDVEKAYILGLLHDIGSLDVVCHFPLNMLIKNPELLNEQECQYAMNPATHLDFLIYNRIGKKPVLAIEVDGYEYHKEDTVQASRDLLKNHIMELYEVPLLRFMTNGSGEKEKIIEMLDKLVG